MSWTEVHDEAEKLEHAASDRLIALIDEMLGRPEVDPHGDPIPAPTARCPRSSTTAAHMPARGVLSPSPDSAIRIARSSGSRSSTISVPGNVVLVEQRAKRPVTACSCAAATIGD